MQKTINAIVGIAVLVAAAIAVFFGAYQCRGVHAEAESRLVDHVVELQPYYEGRRVQAERLARGIEEAARRYGVMPEIGLAMAFCESSLLPSVGRGRIVGPQGERGYFQVMPGGRAEKLCGGRRSQMNLEVNADTAMCYLAYVRDDVCQTNDPWVYVGAYSFRRCPQPWTARRMLGPQRRRDVFCRIVGPTCDEYWPR